MERMSESKYFKFTNSVVIAPLVGVILIWMVFWLELQLHANFNEYGVCPRTLKGLRGVFLSPFIHGSVEHLYNNTMPLAILTASLFYFYRDIAMKVLVYGLLFSGLFTWSIGRDSYHIGASGMIYVLASFIFFEGVFSKYYRLVALSLVVVFIYGSLLWYVFPIEDGISWEGHLGGFVAGLLLAFFMKAETPSPKKFDWEHEDYNGEADEFLKHFDEDGNFIETKPEVMEQLAKPTVQVTYHYRAKDEGDVAKD